MTDQYKEQYQKETEQIHAPADLIARTKAAMREEEMRMQRERSGQTAEPTGWEVKPVAQEPGFAEKKHNWNRTARRWAYPLTAAAAIFILVSISVAMRGLRNLKSDSAPLYDAAAAADSGGGEFAVEEIMEETVCEEAPVMEEAGATDTGSEYEAAAAAGGSAESAAAAVEEEVCEEATVAEESVDAASDMGETTGQASDMGETADAASDMGELAGASEKEAAFRQDMAESADEAKRAAQAPVADYAAEVNVTVKRVWKKPDFAAREDVEMQTYEDKVFWIVKEDEGWAAYVESESRGGYEIRGEAEDMESFLAAGYRRLLEISY